MWYLFFSLAKMFEPNIKSDRVESLLVVVMDTSHKRTLVHGPYSYIITLFFLSTHKQTLFHI